MVARLVAKGKLEEVCCRITREESHTLNARLVASFMKGNVEKGQWVVMSMEKLVT